MLKTILIINFIYFFATSAAFAQINACNTDVTGKKIKWDSSWATDGKDQDVIYKIVRATELKKDKVIILELMGPSKSFIKSRDLLIQNKSMMKKLCAKIESSNNTYTEVKEIDNYDLFNLPFIKYTKNGWQRADTPTNEKLCTCAVLNKTFACSLEDKKKYSGQLIDVEKEVKMMAELGY